MVSRESPARSSKHLDHGKHSTSAGVADEASYRERAVGRTNPFRGLLIGLDLLHLQGLQFIRAFTSCKAVFRSSFGPCRRSQGLDDRRYVLESIGNNLNLVGLVQVKSEKSLCNGWMRVWTATPVNAKGLFITMITT